MGRQAVVFLALLGAASLASQAVLGSVHPPRDGSESRLVWGPFNYTTGPLRAVWTEGYYNNPLATNEEPQPKVKDILTWVIFDTDYRCCSCFP